MKKERLYYLIVEFDTHARGEKDHDLLFLVFLEESVQNSYPGVAF